MTLTGSAPCSAGFCWNETRRSTCTRRNGGAPRPSEVTCALRGPAHGLAVTLALLGIHGDVIDPGYGTSGTQWADRMVRDLLREANADAAGDTWNSLASVLSQLAEAAPDAFLNGVRDATEGRASVVTAMFTDNGPLWQQPSRRVTTSCYGRWNGSPGPGSLRTCNRTARAARGDRSGWADAEPSVQFAGHDLLPAVSRDVRASPGPDGGYREAAGALSGRQRGR